LISVQCSKAKMGQDRGSGQSGRPVRRLQMFWRGAGALYGGAGGAVGDCTEDRAGFQSLESARQEHSLGNMDAFVSQRDLNQLIQCSIDVENLQFAILHGLSDNRFKRMDISDAKELVGYAPLDDLTEENPSLKELKLHARIATHRLDRPQDSGLREDL